MAMSTDYKIYAKTPAPLILDDDEAEQREVSFLFEEYETAVNMYWEESDGVFKHKNPDNLDFRFAGYVDKSDCGVVIGPKSECALFIAEYNTYTQFCHQIEDKERTWFFSLESRNYLTRRSLNSAR